VLERALRGKERSPVAAAVAAALLLRAGAVKRLADWPRNLSDWFPWLPDGPILWAQTLLRRTGGARSRRDRQGSSEAQRYFLEIGRRGVPLLAPVLGMAVDQATAWRQPLSGGIGAGDPPPQLLAACDTVDAAADFAQPDGLFATFWSFEAELEPSTIFGTTRSADAERAGAAAAAVVPAAGKLSTEPARRDLSREGEDYRLISAYSHVSEPPNLWVERVDRKYGDRAPQLMVNPPGKEGAYFYYEGYAPHPIGIGLGAGKSPEELKEFLTKATYSDARPGGWDPAERAKDNALDGVEADVLYTTLGFRIFWLKDPGLQADCFRVYKRLARRICQL
jgi:hypothetical protein